MSFIRVKNKSVVLARSYRIDGKVKQSQQYLGKAEMIEVSEKNLLHIFDWAWYLYSNVDPKKEDFYTFKMRGLRAEFQLQILKKGSEKLHFCLADIINDMRKRNSNEVHTKDLYKAILLAEEIIQLKIQPFKDEAIAISNGLYKLLKKPYRNLVVGLVSVCPECHRPWRDTNLQ